MGVTLHPYPFIVIDTETTGLASDPDARVIELGAVAVDRDGEILAEFSSLVRPDRWGAGTEEALAVNGLSRVLIERAPAPNLVVFAFTSWRVCALPYDRSRVTAYNAPFDRELMGRSGLNIGLEWADWCIRARAYATIGEPLEPIEGQRRVRMQDVFVRLGLPRPEQAHRALADARLAVQLVNHLARVAPNWRSHA